MIWLTRRKPGTVGRMLRLRQPTGLTPANLTSRLETFRKRFWVAIGRSALAICVCMAGLAWAPAAEALDQPLSATRFQIKDQRKLRRGVPKVKRSFDLQSSDASIVAPVAASVTDPSIHGAVLVVVNTTGGGESARIEFPASGWVPQGSGWRFRSKIKTDSGTNKVNADLNDARLRVKVSDKGGAVFGYSLNEATQGSVAAVFELGSGADRYCAEAVAATPKLIDRGEATADCGVRGLFKARKAAAPGACASTAGAPVAADSCDAFELLDLLIEAQMEATGIPGLGAAVVRAGEPLWSKGYGQRQISPSRPVLTDTPFMLASISKTVTATAILQLVDDGEFGLDDDIATILDFNVDNPRVSGDEVITVRQLLTHTSGLVDDDNVWGGYPGESGSLYALGDSPIALRDFMIGYFTAGGTWYDSSLNFTANAPGTNFEYSNLATALLGYLVEAATGTSLDDHSETRIFGPLGMSASGWHLADFTAADVAMPYESFGSSRVEWGQYGFPDYPNGQMRASAQDLARYLAAWASGGILDGQRILEAATVAEALSVQQPAVESTQGLSWYYDKVGTRDVVGHNGGDYGATTDMFFDPATGHGVVVLINTGDTGARIRAMQTIEKALFAIAEAP
ncbi:MAG: CubicO group peptidase (beta-lactamase class C family) [Hyphomicrobiaceae bacterium]|jgi:CubicO group peptidase (beta-lactamase class C family)